MRYSSSIIEISFFAFSSSSFLTPAVSLVKRSLSCTLPAYSPRTVPFLTGFAFFFKNRLEKGDGTGRRGRRETNESEVHFTSSDVSIPSIH